MLGLLVDQTQGVAVDQAKPTILGWLTEWLKANPDVYNLPKVSVTTTGMTIELDTGRSQFSAQADKMRSEMSKMEPTEKVVRALAARTWGMSAGGWDNDQEIFGLIADYFASRSSTTATTANPGGTTTVTPPAADPGNNNTQPVAPTNDTTTTVQILGRPIPGEPSGSLHTSVLVTSGSQSFVASAQPSLKLTGLDSFLNVYGFDRGAFIQPQDLASMARSREYQLYSAANNANFLATYQSQVMSVNRPFNDVMAQVSRFNQDILAARVPYLSSTQNSNSYAFTLAERLTGIRVTPSANYQIPGYNTQLISPAPKPKF